MKKSPHIKNNLYTLNVQNWVHFIKILYIEYIELCTFFKKLCNFFERKFNKKMYTLFECLDIECIDIHFHQFVKKNVQRSKIVYV